MAMDMVTVEGGLRLLRKAPFDFGEIWAIVFLLYLRSALVATNSSVRTPVSHV